MKHNIKLAVFNAQEVILRLKYIRKISRWSKVGVLINVILPSKRSAVL